jgi:hypothetical protein
MFLLYYTTFLLAQADQVQEAARKPNPPEGMSATVYWLLVLAAIVVVGLAVSYAVSLIKRWRVKAIPLGLFWSLCSAHKLQWSERFLLWQLARLEHLTDPARLFLEPEWYNASSLPAELRFKAAQLKKIYHRLFAGLKEGEGTSGGEHAQSIAAVEPKGAALQLSKTAPELDVPPWSLPASSHPPLPPMPPLTNTSDGAPV